jgi:Domain of unknown function (DUF1843)
MAKETGGAQQQPTKTGSGQPYGGTHGGEGGGHAHPLYATPIHNVIAQGDLPAMKALLAEAETYLKDHGDVGAAVQSLRAEIAKRERK